LKKYGIRYVEQSPVQGVDGYIFDFVIPGRKIVVEADGCYWHACPEHHPIISPAGLRDKARIVQRARDRGRHDDPRIAGWTLVRLWEHEINEGDFSKLSFVPGT
jgi:DNA mismatch endonuclease (patch repair protein)